ncbi:CAZyme family AA1 [Paecilomyces variotii]|nr:CAZyme family AA1 [Paecilomyces variotii]KAJ9229821.1 CAZyme family AA1 [Paecilomyces variotii]KAJ9394367.1 CAZyme family AA1 [Paecilomyces variotii]
MERKSSRRRNAPAVDIDRPQHKPVAKAREQARVRGSKSNNLWPTLYSSLAVCSIILFVYIGSGGNGPFRPPLAFPDDKKHQVPHASISSALQLHPENHILREATVQSLNWHISSSYRRPDGVKKRVFLINDEFPGPTIEARSGDTLVITVHNDLQDESLAIHWHGLRGPNSMDGVVGVTQCAIAPGSSFTYNFTIPADQSGTFWYHSHSNVQRSDGLYGGLVVHKPVSKPTVRGLLAGHDFPDSEKYHYNKELLLLVGDWYHRSAVDVLAWYMRAGSFGNEPVPDSLLVNGLGRYNCSMAVPARPVDCNGNRSLPYLDLDPSITYRIRVVNTGSLAGFTLRFKEENLQLIQLDGGIDVESQYQQTATSAGILFPGQRMDLVLKASSHTDKHTPSSLTVELDKGCFKYPNPALTPSHTFPIYYNSASIPISNINSQPPPPPPSTPNDSSHIDIERASSASSILASLPSKAQQTHVVYTKVEKLARLSNVPYGFFNRTTWKPQADPPTPLISLPRQQWDRNQLAVVTGPEPEWVDFIVNNLDDSSHPFHLHGHNFYILFIHKASIGWGSYNPFQDTSPPGLPPSSSNPEYTPYNLTRSILRDTVQIPSRGYAVLRFRADNPGTWLFHCHIAWHLASGMAMVVDVLGDREGVEAHTSFNGLGFAGEGGTCAGM